MLAIRERVLGSGRAGVSTAPCSPTRTSDRPKPIRADFVGCPLPNRYVFGFGMDVQGAWRNLPAIYAQE